MIRHVDVHADEQFQSATVPTNAYSLELSTAAKVVTLGLDTLT